MVRTAIYAGSFDPPTNGHLDIVERASGMFDHLIVALGTNTHKTRFLPPEATVEALRTCCEKHANVSVEMFSGLLVNFAQERGSNLLVRGLRAITDFDYEFRIALANKSLWPEVETVFLVSREEYSFLASSVVREVALLGGDYRKFVPDEVAQLIAQRTV